MNRSTAPKIRPISALRTGFPERQNNIYKLISDEGVFKLEIIFPNAGYGLITNKFHGIFATDLLLSGTASKTAEQIAGEIDRLGGYVFKGCDYYSSSLTIFGMNDNILKLLEIVRDSIYSCNFDQKELDIYKSRKISDLNISLNKTSYLANRSIHQLLTGKDHPYGFASSLPIINDIQRNDLVLYKETYLKHPYYIFTGSDSTRIEKILKITGFETSEIFPIDGLAIDPAVTTEPVSEDFVSKKGSTQNSIRLGKILPSRSHKDYFTINLLNLVLGGYFGSRLMKNIREEKGLTYGIHSSLTPFKTFSLFKISSECNSKLTDQVKQEIHKEIGQLQVQLIDSEELTIAKNYLLGALSRNFDGAFNISERLKTFLDLDSEKDYYSQYVTAIHEISAEDILECANNYFEIKSLKYCVAGEI